MNTVSQIEKTDSLNIFDGGKSPMYPKKYRNLLIEADLIGFGFREINAYYSEERSITLDESSQTWEKTSRPKVDYRDVPLFVCPIIGKHKKVLGSWTHGLDKRTIEIINKECGIPIYDGTELLNFMHGNILDLSNPYDMAKFRILLHCREIALSKGEMSTGIHYYFSSKEDIINERKLKISNRKLANSLNEKLEGAVKRDMLLFMSHEYDMIMNIYDMPNSEINDIFESLCYGEEIFINREGKKFSSFRAIIDAHKRTDRPFRNMANLAVNLAVVSVEGRAGKISRRDGTPIAMDFETFAQLLQEDNVIYQDIGRKVEAAQLGLKQAKANVLTKEAKKTINVGIVKNFDTHIDDISDIKLWGLGACMQYVKEKGIENELSELSGTDQWQELVRMIHTRTYQKTIPIDLGQNPIAIGEYPDKPLTDEDNNG